MGGELGTQSGNCMPDIPEVRAVEDIGVDKFGFCFQNLESANNTPVIIFDWDDTLMCTRAVRTQQWGVEDLQELEVSVEAILRTAMSLGETLIVTNGNATWVQDSARRFLPGLLPILSKLRVVSARALYEDAYPSDPFMWKHAAFEHLLTKERHFRPEPGLNLVALGDQLPEIDAARHVTRAIGGSSLVKTVKFREAPSISELIGQLSRTEQILGNIVQEAQSRSYQLVLQDLPPWSNRLASAASDWQCLTEAECDDGCPMTGIRDLLGFLA